jgi:hypothetical protein
MSRAPERGEVMSRIFASWNLLEGWLWRLEAPNRRPLAHP